MVYVIIARHVTGIIYEGEFGNFMPYFCQIDYEVHSSIFSPYYMLLKFFMLKFSFVVSLLVSCLICVVLTNSFTIYLLCVFHLLMVDRLASNFTHPK